MAKKKPPAKPKRAAPKVGRLPAGRHGLPREFVKDNQRERITAGMAQVALERGYADATVKHVTEAAGVSRRTFYEHFKGKEDCFLATYEVGVARLRDAVIEAAADVDSWPAQIRSGLDGGIRFLAEEPALAHVVLIEGPAAGPEVAKAKADALAELFGALRAGRSSADAKKLAETTEEVVVGGAADMATTALQSGGGTRLTKLLPDLTQFTLTPYLGAAEAARVTKQS